MKGLILKDIMCLRKQLTVFCYVIIGVLIVFIPNIRKQYDGI